MSFPLNFNFFLEQSLARDDTKASVQSTLQRLIEVTEELRRYQRADSQDRERDRARRILGLRRCDSIGCNSNKFFLYELCVLQNLSCTFFRRAASTESDTAAEVPAETRSKPSIGRGGVALQRKGSLMRKTLSLEQTSNAHEQVFYYVSSLLVVPISYTEKLFLFALIFLFFFNRTSGKMMRMAVSIAFKVLMMTPD